LARHLYSSAHTTSALSGPCLARAGIVIEINELRRYPPDRRHGGQPTAARAVRLWLMKLKRIWLMSG
jgi:hypothetical protein